MKVVVVTALWKRAPITEIFFDWHDRLRDIVATMGIELSIIAVVSTDEDLEICVRRNVPRVWSENFPVGGKWNNATESITEFFPDYEAALILGSDDFLSVAYVQEAVHMLRQGVEYVSARTATMQDAASRRVVRFKGKVVIGGGRLVTRELIEGCDNRPWIDEMNDALDKAFDYSMRVYERKRGRPISFAVCNEGTLFTIKTKKVQMWDFDFLCNRTMWDEVNGEEFARLREEFLGVFDKIDYDSLD